MKTICKVKIKWYYAILCGLCSIIDGLSMILTLGHYGTNLTLRMSIIGTQKSWCVVIPNPEPKDRFSRFAGTSLFPDKQPIDYVGKVDRFCMDGDGDPLDDFGTGLGGQPLQNKEKFKHMLMEIIHVENPSISFSWADGLYIIVSEVEDTLNMCALDEKGQPQLYNDGRFMISCTGKNNKGITKTKLKYKYTNK